MLFLNFAKWIAAKLGHPYAFLSAISIVILWGIFGPVFNYSDSWQLIINTSTTIITFLMVFLLQNTQNRDTTAIHLKLDEIIRSIKGAHNQLLNIENLAEEDLQKLRIYYERLANQAKKQIRKEKNDPATPSIEE